MEYVEKLYRQSQSDKSMQVYHHTSSQAERKDMITVNRALMIDELATNVRFNDFIENIVKRIEKFEESLVNLREIDPTLHTWKDKKELVTELDFITQALKEKNALSSKFVFIYEKLVPLIETLLECKQLDTGIILSCLSIYESASFQLTTPHIVQKFLTFVQSYIPCLIELQNPSLSISIAVNISNILGNSLISTTDLQSINIQALIVYMNWLLNLLRLRKSNNFARNSIWFYRCLIIRFSRLNPRNNKLNETVCETFTEAFLKNFRLDEVILTAIKQIQGQAEDSKDVLIEVLWTLAFTVKHFSFYTPICENPIFCQITDVILGNKPLYEEELIMLPYLGYLGGVIAIKASSGMNELVGEDNMKIFNELTSLLQAPHINKRTTREALFVITNYLGTGMNLQIAEITIIALSKIDRIIQDRYYCQELFFLHINFLKCCLDVGISDSEAFVYAKQIVQNSMSHVNFTPSELESTNNQFGPIIKMLRSK